MITPLQQTKISLIGGCFVLIGVVIGLITTFITKTWWLFIILFGSLFLSGISFIGMIQRYWALDKINKQLKEMEKLNTLEEI